MALRPCENDFKSDESVGNLMQVLDMNSVNTYVAIGYGDFVKGVTPVVTTPFLNRRVIMTKGGGDQWNAVDVTMTPGSDDHIGKPVRYFAMYEFSDEFPNYMVAPEFEAEVTLTKAAKTELSNSLDELLGDLTVYWTLWDESEECDDVGEMYMVASPS